MFMQSNEDESTIATPHEIAISCQTQEKSITEKPSSNTILKTQTEYTSMRMDVTSLKNTSRKRKIEKLYQDTDASIELASKRIIIAKQNDNVQSQREVMDIHFI